MSLNISLYDAERYATTGMGNYCKRIHICDFQPIIDDNGEVIKTAEELCKEEKIRILNEQKRKNLEFKLSKTDKIPMKIDTITRVRTNAKIPMNEIKFESDLNFNWDGLGAQQASTILLGSSKRGKSTLLEYIFNKYYTDKRFITTLFSLNSQIPLYKSFRENALTCSVFNKRSERYINLQQYINKKCDNKYWFHNVFDDVLDMQYKKLINNLILTYRNSNMSTILSLQYLYLIPKMIRANANNFLLFGMNSEESIEGVVKTFLRCHFKKMGYDKLADQIELYKFLTDDHGFIYLNPISDKISFHRLNI